MNEDAPEVEPPDVAAPDAPAPRVEARETTRPALRLPRLPLWLTWWAANMVPLGLVPLTTTLLRERLGYASLAAAAYPITFASLALAQGLVLERRVAQPVVWIAATAAGLLFAWVAGGTFMGALDGKVSSEIALVVAAHGLGGALLGAMQALVLRRQGAHAGRWVAANAAAAALFAGLWLPYWADSWIPGYASGRHAGGNELTTILRVAATSGLALGPLLQRILRAPLEHAAAP